MLPASITDQQVRTLAAEILHRDPYVAWRRSELLLPWLEQINDWLRRWNDWIGGLPTWMALAIIFAMTAVAALLLVHVVWSVAVALRHAGPAASPRDRGAGPTFAAEAEALAAQGRFLEAAHRLQLATIELLVRQRRLTLSRFEANRVLRRRVGEATLPAADRRVLIELVDRLERGWFRDRAGDADLYGAWRGLHARLAADAAAA